MLLCTFASPRSAPDQIQRWIAYLEKLRERHQEDPEAVRLVEALLERARSWPAGAAPGRSGPLGA